MKLKPKINKKNAALSLSIVAATVLCDFLTKLAVMKNMEIGESIPLIKDVLHITYITNSGAAFGTLSDARWLFMSVSVILLLALTALILFWEDGNPLFYTATSLILGGGIGNMIDRIAYGEVVDFIDFRAFPKLWKWIFNGADSFVCIGAVLLIIWYIKSEIDHARKSRAENNTRGNTQSFTRQNGAQNNIPDTQNNIQKITQDNIQDSIQCDTQNDMRNNAQNGIRDCPQNKAEDSTSSKPESTPDNISFGRGISGSKTDPGNSRQDSESSDTPTEDEEKDTEKDSGKSYKNGISYDSDRSSSDIENKNNPED